MGYRLQEQQAVLCSSRIVVIQKSARIYRGLYRTDFILTRPKIFHFISWIGVFFNKYDWSTRLGKTCFRRKSSQILEFVDSSALCSGVDINETTSASMSPYVSGEYRHNDNVLFKVFSKQCHIIQCSDGISCANCRKINDWMTNQRKGSYLGMQFIPLPTKDTWQGMS